MTEVIQHSKHLAAGACRVSLWSEHKTDNQMVEGAVFGIPVKGKEAET